MYNRMSYLCLDRYTLYFYTRKYLRSYSCCLEMHDSSKVGFNSSVHQGEKQSDISRIISFSSFFLELQISAAVTVGKSAN